MSASRGLETKFKEAINSIKSKKLDLDLAKELYFKLRKESEETRKKRDFDAPNAQLVETKAAYDTSQNAIAEVEYAVELAGKNIFEQHVNLLSNKSCQPWGSDQNSPLG